MKISTRLRESLYFFPAIMIVFLLATLQSVQSQGLMVSLVPVDADKMVIVPSEEIENWNSDLALVDTSWTLCSGEPGGIGFDSAGDYDKFISLNLSGSRGSTCYIRAKFDVTAGVLAELDYLSIGIRFDDGFIAYLNGVVVASANAPQNPNHRSNASQPHEAQSTMWFDISAHIDKLQVGENLFAVHGMNVMSSSPDLLIQVELVARKNYQRNFVSDLPIVTIRSDGNLPVGNSRRTAVMQIIDNGAGQEHRLTHPANDYQGRIAITQASNQYKYPKNHYSFTLKNDIDETISAPLLDLPAGDEWLFYAPYNDKTLLRNLIMTELAAHLGHAQPARICHLFLNDDYMGIYALQEQNNRHVNRINIAAMTPADSQGDAVTGGYIFAIDNRRSLPGFDSPVAPFRGAPYPVRYLYHYPATDLSQAQESYIQSFINSFEADVVNSIDIASAVDYFLLNEIAKNVDAYRNHLILYKDRDSINPRMFIKSTMDYNNACGNTTLYEGNEVAGWQLDYLRNSPTVRSDSMFVPMWWQQLFDDAAFTVPLYKRWRALKDNVLSEDFVLQKIDSLYQILKDDRVLNFERWSVTGKAVEPYGYIGSTYYDDYDHFYIWMVDRLDWMNDAMEDFRTTVEAEERQISGYALENYPNPFNPVTTIAYRLPRRSDVSLRIYNSRGRMVDQFLFRQQAAGVHAVQWDGSGHPSGVYYYKIFAQDFAQTKRMSLIR
ncbi:CotH kinase family protein [candidate division KSB1 bacterium]|nr:CotH kinase family protein [candidate division KSB1 bacterium]